MSTSTEILTFTPSDYATFRFTERRLSADGQVELRYALDDAIEFVERYQLPVPAQGPVAPDDQLQALLALLHWVAGVSYYKTAAPSAVKFDETAPPPETAALLNALYSNGLGEFAFNNSMPLPRPDFGSAKETWKATPYQQTGRVLVPVGGGKDSAVALEIIRRSGAETSLFSVGDAPPIARTVEQAGLPRLLARRELDPGIRALNAAGALNGHVPITAVVSSVALLTAALNGFDTVALANERSASQGNRQWDGVTINHQFSKSLEAETLMRAAVDELAPGLSIFSVLRPASELAIARAFARMENYHGAFTSCNAIFRLDPELRLSSWCGNCPKCRFVFLILAPFLDPEPLHRIFGHEMFADGTQLEGFRLLTATGGFKPFECVGEEEESVAAIRLLEDRPKWRGQPVLESLIAEVLPGLPEGFGYAKDLFELTPAPAIPPSIRASVDAVLGA